MIDDEARAYLDETHIATLVTLNPDGSPHAVPIWYEYRDDKLHFITMAAGSVKTRNIHGNPRVAVSIANDTSPARYALIEGKAHISTDDAVQTAYRIYQRYQGQERGTQSANEMLNESEMVAIIVEPEKIMSWMGE